jgi:hypothetical protein
LSNASPSQQIIIQGQGYTLKYSVMAYAALQDYFKLASIDEVVQRLNTPSGLGMMDIVAMFWAGLRSHHRDVTLDDALVMADIVGLQALQEIIGNGISASTPPSDNASGDKSRPQ